MIGTIIGLIAKGVGMGIKAQKANFKASEEWDAEHQDDTYKSGLVFENYNKAKAKAIKEKEIRIIKERKKITYGILGVATLLTVTGVLIYKNKI